MMMNFEHNNLKERLDELIAMRKGYHMLSEVISKVLGSEERETSAINEIQSAYSVFAGLDVLDLSREGRIQWE